jgi:hypothetical protein
MRCVRITLWDPDLESKLVIRAWNDDHQYADG